MRTEAIRKLTNAKKIDESLYLVDGQKVQADERDELLKQLEEDKIYLKIPLELFLVSEFWRTLKVESNKEVRQATRG